MGIRDILNKLRNNANTEDLQLDHNVKNNIIKTVEQIKEDLKDRVNEDKQIYSSIVFNVDKDLLAMKHIVNNLEKNGFKVHLGNVEEDISPTLRVYHEVDIKIEFKNSNDKNFKEKVNQVLDTYLQEIKALNKTNSMKI